MSSHHHHSQQQQQHQPHRDHKCEEGCASPSLSGHICSHGIVPIVDMSGIVLLDKYIAKGAWRTQKKVQLFLYQERLGMKGCAMLVEALRVNESLEELLLDLSNNNINDIAAKSLSNGLSQIHSLKTVSLNLFGGSLTDNGCLSLLDGFSNCPALTNLTIFFSNTKVKLNSWQLISKLTKITNQFSNLHALYLSYKFNNISEEDIQIVRRVISKCPSLVKIAVLRI